MYKTFFLIFTFSCTLLMADWQQDQQVEQRRLQRQREDAGRLEQEQKKNRVKSQIEENSERPYHYEDEELYRQEILEDEPFNR